MPHTPWFKSIKCFCPLHQSINIMRLFRYSTYTLAFSMLLFSSEVQGTHVVVMLISMVMFWLCNFIDVIF